MLNVNSAASVASESPNESAGPIEAYAPGLLDALRGKAAELRTLLQSIELHVDDQHAHAKATRDIEEMERLTEADPYRWLADAKHSLQSGVMFLERAVTQRTMF